MYKKLFSVFLVMTIMFLSIPNVNASKGRLNVVQLDEHIAIYGERDSEKLYNFVINTDKGIGQFAAVYSDKPEYLYEYTFTLPKTPNIFSDSFLNNSMDSCLANKSNWKVTHIPSAVRVLEPAQGANDLLFNSSPQGTNNAAYFKSWLEDKHGKQYGDRLLGSTVRNGLTLRWNELLQFEAYRDRSYQLQTIFSVIAFIAVVLSMAVSPGIYSAISIIAGVAGYFSAGTSVYEYNVRADWQRYVTINLGSYPYSTAEKFAFYTGYVSSSTGGQAVDSDSEQIMYTPSLAYYTSSYRQYNDAYDLYRLIGPQTSKPITSRITVNPHSEGR